MVSCDLCNTWFRDNHDLKRHLERKNLCIDTTECQWCNKVFSRKNVLKKHKLICKEKPYDDNVPVVPVIENKNENNKISINIIKKEGNEITINVTY